MRASLCRAGNAGFSLLELLVVLVILAALTGLALLASGSGLGERRGATEMERFALRLELLCDRAVIESRLLGMQLTRSAYEGSELTAEGWLPLGREPAFARVELPAGWQWKLGREGGLLDLPGEWPEEPQLLCLPDGRSTPFRLQLGEDEAGWLLRSEGRGRAQLSAVDA